VKEAAAAVSPRRPDQSLLLPQGQRRHGSRRRQTPRSRLDEYKIIRRWIAAGTPFGKPDDPTVARISIVPNTPRCHATGKQQFAAYAHFTDGSVEDITQRAQYESNDNDMRWWTANRPGADVGAERRGGHHGALPGPRRHLPRHHPARRQGAAVRLQAATLVDRCTQKKWQELGNRPLGTLHRRAVRPRVSLDITGTLPTPYVVKRSLPTPADKRAQLVDALLDTAEYSYYFANKWGGYIACQARQQPGGKPGVRHFRVSRLDPEALRPTSPTTSLPATSSPPSATNALARRPCVQGPADGRPVRDNADAVFLGLRLAVRQCHHHPYEKWSQDDYWGVAGSCRVGRKPCRWGQPSRNQRDQRQAIFSPPRAAHQQAHQFGLREKPLDGDPVEPPQDEDPRQNWPTGWWTGKNPFFARAVANRYWRTSSGGIVDPLDDMRVTQSTVQPGAARRPGQRPRRAQVQPQTPGGTSATAAPISSVDAQ